MDPPGDVAAARTSGRDRKPPPVFDNSQYRELPPKKKMRAADASDVRRSGRDRQSTTVIIDGYAIKRENNYRVKGLTYVYNEDQPDDDEDYDPRPIVPKRPPVARKPRVQSRHEVDRMAHNGGVGARVVQKKPRRDKFLADRVDILRPFVDPATLARITQDGKRAAKCDYAFKTIKEQPEAIKADMRDYQMAGLNFLVKMYEHNVSAILGDEMGLGKTLQTISFIAHLKQKGITGSSLVVVPLSVLESWCNEIQKWAPSLTHFRLHGSSLHQQEMQRSLLTENPLKYDIVVTTYEMIKTPPLRSYLARTKFNVLCLDEGHRIKAHDTKISQQVRRIHSEFRLLLTGTPLQNNLVELWSLLNFLLNDVFLVSEPFEAAFNLSENVIDRNFLGLTQKVLDMVMLRRLKSAVETSVPPKIETKVYCPLSKTQEAWYKSLLMKDANNLSAGAKANFAKLRSLFMQLRKCCNHPFLFRPSTEDPIDFPLEESLAASGKLAVLDKLLVSLISKGHRVVIFSQFTTMLDLIEDYCIARGWNYCFLDGSVSRAQRSYRIRRFNEPNSPYSVFLLSTRAGGMGINLQTADTCILFDSDWNPQQDIQAMARVHRIGQKKTVHVYRLICKGTMEERMIQRAEKKLLLEVVNAENGRAPNDGDTGLSAEAILDDIKFGSEAVFGGAPNKLPSEADIELITDRNRTESTSAGLLTGGKKHTAKSFVHDENYNDTMKWGGVNFKELRNQREKDKSVPKGFHNMKYLWDEIKSLDAKRKKKDRLVMVDGLGSGYGMKSVPVLAANNYDLLAGESSVFDRELKSQARPVEKKKKAAIRHQDFCQACGSYESRMVRCQSCPVSLCNNRQCCGNIVMGRTSCNHHHCSVCDGTASGTGGLLYICYTCPTSYCDDCLPEKGITLLDGNDRYEELGFPQKPDRVYIFCEHECKRIARRELGWKPPIESDNIFVPDPIDVSYNFGDGEPDAPPSNPSRAALPVAASAEILAAVAPSAAPSSNSTFAVLPVAATSAEILAAVAPSAVVSTGNSSRSETESDRSFNGTPPAVISQVTPSSMKIAPVPSMTVDLTDE